MHPMHISQKHYNATSKNKTQDKMAGPLRDLRMTLHMDHSTSLVISQINDHPSHARSAGKGGSSVEERKLAA